MQMGDDLPQGCARRHAMDAIAGEFAIEVALAQAEGAQFEAGMAGGVVEAQRIKRADDMADIAVGVDQSIGTLLVPAPRDGGGGLGTGGWRRGCGVVATLARARTLEAEVESREEDLPFTID